MQQKQDLTGLKILLGLLSSDKNTFLRIKAYANLLRQTDKTNAYYQALLISITTAIDDLLNVISVFNALEIDTLGKVELGQVLAISQVFKQYDSIDKIASGIDSDCTNSECMAVLCYNNIIKHDISHNITLGNIQTVNDTIN